MRPPAILGLVVVVVIVVVIAVIAVAIVVATIVIAGVDIVVYPQTNQGPPRGQEGSPDNHELGQGRNLRAA